MSTSRFLSLIIFSLIFLILSLLPILSDTFVFKPTQAQEDKSPHQVLPSKVFLELQDNQPSNEAHSRILGGTEIDTLHSSGQ